MKNTKIVINGLKWAVVPFNRNEEQYDGQTSVSNMTIKFNALQDKQMVEKTLIHELVHATLDSFGFGTCAKDNFSTEEVCEFIAMNCDNIVRLKNEILRRVFEDEKDD